MTRTITVTGGFSGAVTFDITDTLKQLTYATFRVALTEVGQDDPPPVDSPSWLAATATQSAGSATVSALVEGITPVGNYNAVIDVVSDGRHEVTWALDRSNRNRRALVVVT